MTTVFEGSPKFGGIGDHASAEVFEDWVLILAVDAIADKAVTIALTPAQARDLAQGIIAAAEKAEARA